MCSRVLATIFIIYCLNTGFSEDLLDLSCTENWDCEHFKGSDQSVVCSKESCICSDINGQDIKCKPVTSTQNNIIGGPCPCKMEHSACKPMDEICLCKLDFIASYDRRRCVKKSLSLRERCEDNSQCMSRDHFSYCDPTSKMCSCLENFIEIEGECVSVIGINEDCVDHMQCANRTKFTVCDLNSSKKCVCAPGLVANNLKTRCLPSVGYFGACAESNQCHIELGAGAECFDDVCICDSHHSPVNVTQNGKTFIKCQKKAALGDYCTKNKDCYQYHLEDTIQPMECYLGECRCRGGYSFNDGVCRRNGSTRFSSSKFHILMALLLPTMNNVLIWA